MKANPSLQQLSDIDTSSLKPRKRWLDWGRSARIKTLAQVNQLEFQPKNVNLPHTTGTLFTDGQHHQFSNHLNLGGGREMADLQYVVHNGFWRRRMVSLTYLRLPLKRNMPHVLLDARRNKIVTAAREYQAMAIDTDANFGQNFVIYASPRAHIDVLQVLSPEVLAIIMDYFAACDLEIGRGYLTIFAPQDLMDNGDALHEFLCGAEMLTNELDEHAGKYRPSNFHYHYLKWTNMSLLRWQLRQFGQKYIWILLVVAIVVYLAYLGIKTVYNGVCGASCPPNIFQ